MELIFTFFDYLSIIPIRVLFISIVLSSSLFFVKQGKFKIIPIAFWTLTFIQLIIIMVPVTRMILPFLVLFLIPAPLILFANKWWVKIMSAMWLISSTIYCFLKLLDFGIHHRMTPVVYNISILDIINFFIFPFNFVLLLSSLFYIKEGKFKIVPIVLWILFIIYIIILPFVRIGTVGILDLSAIN